MHAFLLNEEDLVVLNHIYNLAKFPAGENKSLNASIETLNILVCKEHKIRLFLKKVMRANKKISIWWQ